MEILIIHPGGLGDVILSLPAVALLRKRFPGGRITVAGNIDHLVPVMSGYAEKIVSISALPLHRLYTQDTLEEEDISFWRSYDLIVSWTGGVDPQFTARFTAIHPNVRVASWRPAPDDARHVSQLFVDSLDPGDGAKAKAVPTPVLLDSTLLAEGREWLMAHGWSGRGSLTAIHPGAGSKSKRWPVSGFVKLARHLAFQEKKKLLVIEGDAERGLSKGIVSALPRGIAIVFDFMSLPLLAAVVAQCSLFIGNDSGVAHLAAALKIRSLVIFGPTLPRHWVPLGPDVTVLREPRGCEACAAIGESHTCLENITPEEVMRNLI